VTTRHQRLTSAGPAAFSRSNSTRIHQTPHVQSKLSRQGHRHKLDATCVISTIGQRLQRRGVCLCRPLVGSNELRWAMSVVIKVVRAFSRCADPVVICNMLLDRGECHETRNIRGLGNPVTGTPTTEAEPPCVLVISVGILPAKYKRVCNTRPYVKTSLKERSKNEVTQALVGFQRSYHRINGAHMQFPFGPRDVEVAVEPRGCFRKLPPKPVSRTCS